MLENARRRWPAVRFEVRNVAVQGVHAVPQVVQAVKELDALPEVDVIIVARGGGSVEDLLPFSDEQLVRAVAACRTPVVSAIGHEPDSPLLDLVADLRASTPDGRGQEGRAGRGRGAGAGAAAAGPGAADACGGSLDREERGLAHALAPARRWSDPQRMVDERADAGGRAARTGAAAALGHLLDRADSELRTPGRGWWRCRPPRRWSGGTRCCSGRTAMWSARRTRSAPGEELRARVAEGEFTVRVDGGPDGRRTGRRRTGCGDA